MRALRQVSYIDYLQNLNISTEMFMNEKLPLRVGEEEERERALDDVFGIWVTVRSCCENRIEAKLWKSC